MRYGTPAKLKSRKCSNTEDIFTLESVTKIPDHDLIALDIGSQRYICFHFDSLYEWAIQRGALQDPAYRFTFNDDHIRSILAFKAKRMEA